MGQLAVVGDENQAFAAFIESSDREQPQLAGGNQIDGPRPARRIGVGTQIPAGLVEHEITQRLLANRVAVDRNTLPMRIDARAQSRFTSPSMLTRPAVMYSSHRRRDPNPVDARNRCSRTPSASSEVESSSSKSAVMGKSPKGTGVRKEAREMSVHSSSLAVLDGRLKPASESDHLHVDCNPQLFPAFAEEKSRQPDRPFFAALAKTADVILTRLYVFAATPTPDTRRNNDTP